MVEFLHNESLVDDGFDLLFADQFVFAHDLHRVEPPRVFFADQDHPTEGSSPNDLDLLEIAPCHLVAREGKLREVSS